MNLVVMVQKDMDMNGKEKKQIKVCSEPTQQMFHQGFCIGLLRNLSLQKDISLLIVFFKMRQLIGHISPSFIRSKIYISSHFSLHLELLL
ncbi:unnamed protein product [Victoria cruziana]